VKSPTFNATRAVTIQARPEDFEPNQWMLWGTPRTNEYTTWYWGLYPLDESQTRLITRVRMRYHWLSPMIVIDLLVEFTDIVMMRKCMLGIKQRVERAREVALPHASAIG
jgi:hypothetical protein